MTKEFIIQHATNTFLGNGYKTVTMDEVASDLGVSKKTLYEIFGNKESLIRASLEYQFQDLRDIFKETIELELDAIDEIQFIMHKIRSKFSTAQHKNAVYQLQKYYAKIYKKVYVEQLVFVQNAIKSNIEKGQAKALYRKNVNAMDFADLLIRVQNYLKNNENNLKNSERMERMARMNFDLMMRGILTPAGLIKYEKLEINEK